MVSCSGVCCGEDVFVPARSQQRADGGFTHFAAVAFAVFGQQRLERLDAFDADQVEQLLARIGEVFAQVVVDLDALLAQLGVQHLSEQRDAAAAAGAGLGFCLQRRHGVAAFVDRLDDVAFADVEAGADLRAFRQRIHADGRFAARVGRQDQAVRVFRQFDAVQRQLQQVAIIAGVAHQHRAEQGFVVGADHDAFVDFFAFIQINVAAGALGAAVGIADAADVHAQQLQLGAHVGALEAVSRPSR